MKILVSQRYYDTGRSHLGKYVVCGVIQNTKKGENYLNVNLEKVPDEIYQKLEPLIRKKRFEGAILQPSYSIFHQNCWLENFPIERIEIEDDTIGKTYIFKPTSDGFKYRKINSCLISKPA